MNAILEFDSSIKHPASIHIESNAMHINIDSLHPAAIQILINKDLYEETKSMYLTLLNK
jgi:hypothetical protein